MVSQQCSTYTVQTWVQRILYRHGFNVYCTDMGFIQVCSKVIKMMPTCVQDMKYTGCKNGTYL